MYLTNNIDIVQINIKQGVEEYYLPKNVNWRDRVIDKIVLALSPANSTLLSPIDGQTQVLTPSDISDLYFDLYAADDTQIVRNLSFEQILHTNNNPLYLNQKLSLNLSRLYFTTTPAQDGCILLYVYYGGKQIEETEPAKESVTVSVPLSANGKVSLQDIVDNYIYMQPKNVKSVYLWDWKIKPVYLTLRSADNKHTLNSIFSSLCRPPLYETGNTAVDAQAHSLLLDNINIDMLNSFVQNAQNAVVEVRLTFLY